MVLSLLAIVIVGLVAYFHFLEGFFSATLSAILAVISAVVALGFYEKIIASLLQGKMAEMAHSLVLVALFVGVYLILRVIFDKVVPGYVHVPLALEKAGAAVMGIIAGVCAAGIFTIAAQAMPFGPSAAGYSRYPLLDPQTMTAMQQIPGVGARPVDAVVTDALKDETLKTGKGGLILPVDSIVLGLTAKLSDGGALAGAVPFGSVHPDYPEELFFQRIGVQQGAKHVVVNTDSVSQVQLQGLYALPTLQQADSEDPKTPYTARWQQPPAISVRADGGNILLIARVIFSGEAGDEDGNIRLGLYASRLVVGGTNYFPIGTLDHESAPFIRTNRPDDFLIVPTGAALDLVFYVPADALGVPSDPRSTAPWNVTNGFIEVKRMGRVELAGHEIKRQDPGVAQASVMRKVTAPLPRGITKRPAAAAPGTAAPGSEAPPGGGPLENVQSKVAPQFINPINVGRFDGDADVTFNGGKASIKDKKFAKLQLDPTAQSQGAPGVDYAVAELYEPEGKRAVAISGEVPAGEGANPWDWATKLSQFTLVDSGGGTFKPHGAWAKVKVGAADSLVARYDADAEVAQIPQSEARPTDVWIVFIVPSNTGLQELKFGDARIASVNITVP